MPRSNSKPLKALLESMLDEASWLLSHAQSLSVYGREEEAGAERARAALCEEQVACLLDSDGQASEASIHRVSAASCYEKLGQYTRAVTLLRAALSGPLRNDHRARVERLLTHCLAQAQKQMRSAASGRLRKPTVAKS